MRTSTKDSDRSFGAWLGGIALAVVAAVTLFNVASAEAHTLDYRTARIVAADYARGSATSTATASRPSPSDRRALLS